MVGMPHPARLSTLTILMISLAFAADWDRFRGPNGSGVAATSGLPAEFGPAKNVVWKTGLPAGHSSPVVSRDRIFVTAAAEEKLFTIALDRATGSMVWRAEAPRARKEKLHALNHPASPSPVADGRNVWVFFPDYGMLSYTWDGKERWRTPLGPFQNVYGIGVSPVLADDKVILVIDQNRDSYILALGRNDGRVKWKRPRPEALSGSSTPIVIARPGAPAQILAPSSFRMDVYSAADGEAAWWVRGLPAEMKSVPVLSEDTVYISGYNSPENEAGKTTPAEPWKTVLARQDANHDGFLQKDEAPGQREKRYWEFIDLSGDGKVDESEWKIWEISVVAENGLYAFRIGGAGDLTGRLAWKFQRSIPQLPSLVLYQDILYMINDKGVLTTLHPKTGEAYKQARLRGVSDDYYASPVAADGKVFFASHKGVVAVLKAGPDQELLAANNFDDEIFATPAIADSRIYIRTRSALYCIGNK